MDVIVLLKLDGPYLEALEIKDLHPILQGSHLSRAIAQIVGKDGKTKLAIEANIFNNSGTGTDHILCEYCSDRGRGICQVPSCQAYINPVLQRVDEPSAA
jgi:hypothetical protein